MLLANSIFDYGQQNGAQAICRLCARMHAASSKIIRELYPQTLRKAVGAQDLAQGAPEEWITRGRCNFRFELR